MRMLSVLSIAGSDSSGGAGIQADIKTIAAHHMFAQTAVTALTAQNTQGVAAVAPTDPDLVEKQIDAVFSDIRPDAVKVGMVPSAEIACAIGRALARHGAENVVVDPVMVATSGSSLSCDAAIEAVVDRLFGSAVVVTPNLDEAQSLSGMRIGGRLDAQTAAERIARLGPAYVLVKGGHNAADPASDYLFCVETGEGRWIEGCPIDNPNTHGTGCTLSSAIACGLASGKTVDEAVREAKAYLEGALSAQLDLGSGAGPIDHLYMLG